MTAAWWARVAAARRRQGGARVRALGEGGNGSGGRDSDKRIRQEGDFFASTWAGAVWGPCVGGREPARESGRNACPILVWRGGALCH